MHWIKKLDTMDKNEEFFENLKNKLNETTTFPSTYLYKFIIPADPQKLKQIENIFNYEGAVINTKTSRTGKFTSVSIFVKMNSAEEIIAKYEEAIKVEGVISL